MDFQSISALRWGLHNIITLRESQYYQDILTPSATLICFPKLQSLFLWSRTVYFTLWVYLPNLLRHRASAKRSHADRKVCRSVLFFFCKPTYHYSPLIPALRWCQIVCLDNSRPYWLMGFALVLSLHKCCPLTLLWGKKEMHKQTITTACQAGFVIWLDESLIIISIFLIEMGELVFILELSWKNCLISYFLLVFALSRGKPVLYYSSKWTCHLPGLWPFSGR